MQTHNQTNRKQHHDRTPKNILHYGLQPSCDSIMNTAAIRIALAACRGEGGGAFFIPEGVFYLRAENDESEYIAIEQLNNITIYGAGTNRSELVLEAGSEQTMFRGNNSSGLNWSDLSLYITHNKGANSVMLEDALENISFRKVSFKGAAEAIRSVSKIENFQIR